MVTRKYISDYRMENVLDEKTGKLRTVPVYRGDLYSFIEDETVVKKAKKLYTILSILQTVILFCTLMVNSGAARTFYVSLPAAGMVIPVYYCLASMLRLLTAKESFSREHADKLSMRYTTSSFAVVLLSGVSIVGHIVYICLGKAEPLDMLFLLGTVLMFVCGLLMFIKRNMIASEKTGSAKIVYDDED